MRRCAQRAISLTIAEAAYEAKKAELKNDGINARWFTPLQLRILPKLGNLSVEDITQQDITQTLKPIWETKAETAKKAINRLNIVFTYAAAAGLDVDLNAIAKAINRLIELGLIVKKGVQLSAQ